VASAVAAELAVGVVVVVAADAETYCGAGQEHWTTPERPGWLEMACCLPNEQGVCDSEGVEEEVLKGSLVVPLSPVCNINHTINTTTQI
jgi:hypothetical protein